MQAWKAVILLNVALAVGLGGGYLWWGQQVSRLERELTAARAAVGPREWRVAGVVRAVVPEINMIIITHDDIPGYMPAMTMGFRTANPTIHEGVGVGDAVRFTLRGTPPEVMVTAIEPMTQAQGERVR